MNIMELTLLGIFDLLGYTIVSDKLIHNHISITGLKSTAKNIVYILIISCIMGIAGFFLSDKYNILISAPLVSIYIFLKYKTSFKETIYLYIISTIILLLSQYIGLALMRILGSDLSFTFSNGLISQSISLFLAYCISRKFPINVLYTKLFQGNRTFNYLTYNVFALLMVILLYRFLDMEGAIKNIITILALSIGIILVNLILIKNDLRNEYERKMLTTYENYLPIIDELMKEIREKQHEFDNHAQALYMLTTGEGENNQIVSSIKSYMDDLESNMDTRSLLKLDNKILAGFLYSKVKKAKQLGIEFQITIKDFEFKTCLKDYQLVEVLGTLIDNAFETKIENNRIILQLTKEKDMSVIEIKNKHPYLEFDIITNLFAPGFSTKSNSNRGYGLSNLKKTINDYNGSIEVYNRDFENENYVFLKISIPGRV